MLLIEGAQLQIISVVHPLDGCAGSGRLVTQRLSRAGFGMWLLVFVLLLVAIAWSVASARGKNAAAPVFVAQVESGQASSRAKKWESNFWSSGDVRRVAAALRIDYEDSGGNETTRDIHVRFVAPHDDTLMISAHCSMRDSVRTFRADRVLSAVDLSTGEVIEDVEEWLRSRSGIRPDDVDEQDEEMPIIWRVARVLRYVGAADGQFRKAERAIVAQSICDVAGVSGMPAEDVELLLMQHGRPGCPAFLESLEVLKGHQDVLGRLLPVAEAMVATQKTVHPDEAAALSEIRARLTA